MQKCQRIGPVILVLHLILVTYCSVISIPQDEEIKLMIKRFNDEGYDCIPKEWCNDVWATKISCCQNHIKHGNKDNYEYGIDYYDYLYPEYVETKPTTTTIKPTTKTTKASFVIPDCGNQRFVPTKGRIIGGVMTDVKEATWHGLIFYLNSEQIICGGSLISDRHVVTAAHCLSSRAVEIVGAPSRVRFGETNLKTNPDCTNNVCANVYVEHQILTYRIHPKYKFNGNYNDFAVITLATRVIFNEFISPICLPPKDLRIPINTRLIVTGFGRTEKDSSSPVKMKVDVPLRERVTCDTAFKNLTSNRLDNSQICVGGEKGRDSCNGDSGGSLVHYLNGRWILCGVVSFGHMECGRTGMPAVYSYVPDQIDWIYSTMKY